ncbi:MAG: DeoR/GlpR family DNA-binding transcription regulator [Pirellulaceae bacterium]|nr:DeoR/GlpR transcriptional regulator [Planctomycetales bacterium]
MSEERRAQVLELIRQRGFAALTDLAQELNVSESTIRRDLDFLEEAGGAQRTHGGAFYTGPTPHLPHFRQRQYMQSEKKRQVAAAAAALVEDGDVVLLDGGSTTFELARLLVGRPVQVITNSLPVANLFTSSDGGDLILLGGYVHLRTGVTLGPYANEMLRSLNVRRAFISVAGITERGYFNSNLLLVETEQAMQCAAEETIVLADSTKFGHQSLALLCELGKIDHLVVDSGIGEDWRDRMKQAGVKLTIAELPQGNNGDQTTTIQKCD